MYMNLPNQIIVCVGTCVSMLEVMVVMVTMTISCSRLGHKNKSHTNLIKSATSDIVSADTAADSMVVCMCRIWVGHRDRR